MKTYEFYKNRGPEWIEKNIGGLCGDCEMVRAPHFDYQSDAYVVGDYILHINYSGCDVLEAIDANGQIAEAWFLDK